MAEEMKKISVIGISCLLLVAMVVGTVVMLKGPNNESGSDGQLSTSNKAVAAICSSTEFKERCASTLSMAAGNTTDLKEIVKAAFQVTIDEIKRAMENSSTLKELANEPSTAEALRVCQNVLQFSIDDLNRTLEKFGGFENDTTEHFLNDLKVWLSGAITFQENCLDAFENTKGNAGEEMRKLLEASRELTTNGLDIITYLSSLISSVKLPINRRLLSEKASVETKLDADGFPKWINPTTRHLLHADIGDIKPNVIVAQDGSGKYETINEALKDIPPPKKIKGGVNETFIIYVKAGIYQEYVEFTAQMEHVMLIGDGPTKTKITGNKNAAAGTNTYFTATVAAHGFGFTAMNIGIENTAGPKGHQAVALFVNSDKSIIYNCQLDGYQDTLLANTHRQFYRDCIISGTIDFIFGDSAAIFQNCKMVVRKPDLGQQCAVTAQGRTNPKAVTAFVLQKCTIVGDPAYLPVKLITKAYLGRPWKDYSRTIIMDSDIDDSIDATGWLEWGTTGKHKTSWFAEVDNKGAGANMLSRVKWIHKATSQDVSQFFVVNFLEGTGSDPWIKARGVPVDI